MNRIKRTRRMTVITAVVMSVIIMAACSAFSAAEKATVMKVSGNVLAMAPGGSWTPVSVGAILTEGTKVKTSKDSEVFMKWSGDNVIKVAGLSMIELTKMQSSGKTMNSQIGLSQGRIFAKVKKLANADSSFEVKTPAAIAGVRGTGFSCDFTPGEPAVFAVAEGTVSVEAGGQEVEVGEGMMSQVEEGAAPTEPEAVPPEQMEELQNDNKQAEEVAVSEVPAGEELKAEPEKTDGGEGIEQATDDDAAEKIVDAISDVVDTTQQAEEVNQAIEEAMQTGTLEIIIR